jgi:hypothetical protein
MFARLSLIVSALAFYLNFAAALPHFGWYPRPTGAFPHPPGPPGGFPHPTGFPLPTGGFPLPTGWPQPTGGFNPSPLASLPVSLLAGFPVRVPHPPASSQSLSRRDSKAPVAMVATMASGGETGAAIGATGVLSPLLLPSPSLPAMLLSLLALGVLLEPALGATLLLPFPCLLATKRP